MNLDRMVGEIRRIIRDTGDTRVFCDQDIRNWIFGSSGRNWKPDPELVARVAAEIIEMTE